MNRRILVPAMAVALVIGALTAPRITLRTIPYAVHRQTGDSQ